MQMETLKLAMCPIPPSQNQIYRNLTGRGRVKTKEYIKYEKKFKVWAEQNYILARCCQFISKEIRLDAIFYFPRSEVYCKDKSVKSMDVFNRIKALHDCFEKNTGIDDRFIFSGLVEKKVCNTENGYVDLFISINQQGVENEFNKENH